jgi:hypothetical protein
MKPNGCKRREQRDRGKERGDTGMNDTSEINKGEMKTGKTRKNNRGI